MHGQHRTARTQRTHTRNAQHARTHARTHARENARKHARHARTPVGGRVVIPINFALFTMLTFPVSGALHGMCTRMHLYVRAVYEVHASACEVHEVRVDV